MRVVTNRGFIRKRAMIGRICTPLGFLALFGGLGYTWLGFGSAQETSTIVVSYAALIAGYVLISIGKNNWLRFSLHPRPDEALAINLKSLDVKTILFNYIPTLPVDHLVYTPNGLVVIETRSFVSDIAVRGDRWSRRGAAAALQFFSEGALGNPTKEALRGAEQVKAWLAERLGGAADPVPVAAMVVMTHPRARIHVEEPTIPVVHARDTRPEVRKLASGPRLPNDVARRVETLLLDESRPFGEPVNAGEAVDRKPPRRRRKAAGAR